MNPNTRQIAAEIVIGLVICFAAAEFLLLPARRELREQRASIAGMVPTTSALLAPGEKEISHLKAANDRGRREIVLRSAASKDEAALFAEIMAIAERQRIRVEQFEPSTAAPGTASANPQPLPGGEDGSRPDIIAAYNINLSGGYSGVVRFLDELRHSPVFVNPRTVRIAPIDGDNRGGVHAELLVEFYGFDVRSEDPSARPSPEVRP
ncbi:MAG TPA: hypothetical protein VF777_14020 [Phycisphaerales bacterium]